MTPSYRLDAQDLVGLHDFLRSKEWLADSERVLAAERAGDGNMNLTLRVRTEQRTLIVKQGRPWVEKYPHIAAPADRTIVEGRFYELVQRTPAVAERMPRLLGLDAEARVLALQDHAEARDLTALYAGAQLDPGILEQLVAYLVHLHQAPVRAEERPLLRNEAMRALNHEHIFRFPLDPRNGLQLDGITAGLQALAAELMADAAYVARVRQIGELYLGSADGSLLHGDYFPGSWLLAAGKVLIIDPEFCFLGPREFDVGVMLGHLHLAAQPAPSGVLARYEQAMPLDRPLVQAVAGIEIMRRLIGVAQLPLRADLEEKRRLLRLSRELVLEGG